MRWDDMRGDSRSRFCEHCQLHVQNLSAVSQRSAARVLSRSEHERVCVTYTRRADGTLVTRWDTIVDFVFSQIRRGFGRLLAACVPLVLSAFQTQSQLTGRVGPGCKASPQKTVSAEQERVIVTGHLIIDGANGGPLVRFTDSHSRRR
jgi:hypothetical protein